MPFLQHFWEMALKCEPCLKSGWRVLILWIFCGLLFVYLNYCATDSFLFPVQETSHIICFELNKAFFLR